MWPWTGLRAGCRSPTEATPQGAAAGFTLIEVLTAFVILALAFAALLPAFANGLRSLDTADDYATAALLAQSRLELVGRAEPLQAGTSAGAFDDRFRWRLELEPLPLEHSESDLPLHAYSVVLTVEWDGAGADRSVRFETLRLGPPIERVIQPPARPGSG